MAKKKNGEKPETKSDFLRRVLSKNPNLEYKQVNQRWAKAGRAGEISNALYYQIRAKLGIRSVWMWVKEDEVKPRHSPPALAKGEVYQFKITLLGTQPSIWRRIQVSDCTLDKLNEHIQTAMGWTNSHMHQFRIDGKLYSPPGPLSEAIDMPDSNDSTLVSLSAILPQNNRSFRFEFEYDFGDSWLHEVLFEGRQQAEPKKRYPICLEGARACPPEDVGGVWGYAEFQEAIADPKHEQHDELLEWAGGKFDPEQFSPEAATTRMKKGLPSWW